MWGDDMKIGVIQASSQIEKNTILYECTKDYGEVINFGCFDRSNYISDCGIGFLDLDRYSVRDDVD